MDKPENLSLKPSGLAKAVIYSVELTISQKRELENALLGIARMASKGDLNANLEAVRKALREARPL